MKKLLPKFTGMYFSTVITFKKKNIEKFLKKYHTTYEVRELQQYALNTLLDFDVFCKKNNFEYFLAEGTLLGAVRHGGFVPWDDDVDVIMKRRDYDKFISLVKNNYVDGYVVDSFETNPKHWTVCAKVLINTPNHFCLKRLNGIALSTAPGIDVFALDDAPSRTPKEQKKATEKLRLLRVMLWLKTGYSHDYSTIKWKACKFLSLFTSVSSLHEKIEKFVRSGKCDNPEWLVNYGGLYPVEKETFKSEWFSSKATLKFEGYDFPVPENYEKVLTQIYGDYMRLPPYSMRLPKHSYFVNS